MSNAERHPAARELEALFPGLTRQQPPARPGLEGAEIRALDQHKVVDPIHPDHPYTLAFFSTRQLQRVNDSASRCLGAYWADPRRMTWTPVLAGVGLRLFEMEPSLFPHDFSTPAGLLSEGLEGRMDEIVRMAAAELALTGAAILRTRVKEEWALAELGLDPSQSLADRVAALGPWLAVTTRPAAWVAAQLPAALALGDGIERMLLAKPPFRELGEVFAALVERQGMTSWQEAMLGTIPYWRDPRATAWLASLARPAGAAPAVPVRPERATTTPGQRPAVPPAAPGGPPPNRMLVKKLATRLGRAKREVEAAQAEAEALRVRLSALTQDLAEARRGRDRAAERLRKVEGECEELRKALAAASVTEPAPSPADPGPHTVSASSTSGRGVAAERPSQVMAFPAPAAPAVTPPRPEAVLSGRQVYLYTGVERAATRDAMAAVLEHHGARVEVYDGNRQTLLGPDRFPADALVIIETSHLCHSNSDRLVARARASGAWYWVGSSGCGALARKVAERWVRRERGVG